MKILVLSDTHGRISRCTKALDEYRKVDLLIHLGDVASDVDTIKLLMPKTPIESVLGNNDFSSFGHYSKTIEAGGKKLFLTHGHNFRVNMGLDTLAAEVIKEGADIGLFGHTHTPFDGYEAGAHLFNPGSASLPADGVPTFGIITIDNGVIKTEIRDL